MAKYKVTFEPIEIEVADDEQLDAALDRVILRISLKRYKLKAEKVTPPVKKQQLTEAQ